MSGFDLIDKMKKQADKFNAHFIEENVTAVGLEGFCKIVETGNNTYRVKSVIIATGAHPRKLAVPGEERLTGRGVSYCATCDGALYRDKIVAVVGGGDSAIEEALFLTRFTKKVYIINRRDELRAVKIVQERALKNPKIEIVWDSIPTGIDGFFGVESVKIKKCKNQ